MTLKITLITPPDIYENNNDSIMLLNLTEAQQTAATECLGQVDSEKEMNIYFYTDEPDVHWILHSMAASKYKYINADNAIGVSGLLLAYILSKPNTFYSSEDPNVSSVFGYINTNRVSGITEFFERTLGAKKQ